MTDAKHSYPMTLKCPAPSEEGPTIPAGSIVGYVCHVPGGMVRVRWNGAEYVIHPATTRELSGA